jgi:hypothetical protein
VEKYTTNSGDIVGTISGTIVSNKADACPLFVRAQGIPDFRNIIDQHFYIIPG